MGQWMESAALGEQKAKEHIAFIDFLMVAELILTRRIFG